MTEKLAFPAPSEMDQDDVNKVIKHKGMTLRDYFAAKAMAGDFAAQNELCGEIDNDTPYEWMLGRAKLFYRMADAMMQAREK